MSSIALRIQNISKKYRIGTVKHDTLRDQIAHIASSPFRRTGNRAAPDGDEFWALKDVSFDVHHGEIVGIIGRNGAGKSTLLKILSRITAPTSGKVEIYGKIGSLLEVGTGFHPELTGRENIYLNGAILGMHRTEIDKKFNHIVSFSELTKFLDTPVKRYSSGMYVRLAFAVAAHLETEILLVDEVLAVGDAEFQRKCLGKIGDVASQGRTVLFVSHNMAVIQSICQRGLYIEEGKIVIDDQIDKVVSCYLSNLDKIGIYPLNQRTDRLGRGEIHLIKIRISSEDKHGSETLASGHPAQFEFFISEVKPGLACTFTIYNQFGIAISTFRSAIPGPNDDTNSAQGKKVICKIDELLLPPGKYRINAAIKLKDILEDRIEAAAFFEVAQGQLRGRPVASLAQFGNVLIPHHWILPS